MNVGLLQKFIQSVTGLFGGQIQQATPPDDWECHYCGWRNSMKAKYAEIMKTDLAYTDRYYRLEQDHVRAKSKGGTSVVPARGCCNNKKRDMARGEFVRVMKANTECQECWRIFNLKGGKVFAE